MSLGDFVDYSTHPTVMMKGHDFNPKVHLVKESRLTYRTLHDRLVLPTYWFASGRGSRGLTRKDFFNIWGLSDLENTSIELDWLFEVLPTQIANLLLASFFSEEKSQHLSLEKSQVIKNEKLTLTKLLLIRLVQQLNMIGLMMLL